MENKYIHGRIYSLDKILMTNQSGHRYILCGNGKRDYVIHFGRRRRFEVPEECYTVIFYDDDYKLEKILFDEKRECNYLKELDKQGVEYSIPQKLPDSHNRDYTRLQVAVGDTWWARYICAYLGRNGFAITDEGYIGDDRYTNFKINLCKNTGSMRMGDHCVKGISGFEIPKEEFIKKILTENICVEEGEPLLALIREAGLLEDIKNLRIKKQEV